MKRQTETTKPPRSAKRTKDDKPYVSIFGSAEPAARRHNQRTFFRLPREVRDQIYLDASEPTPITHVHRDLRLIAFPGSHTNDDDNHPWRHHRGLPSWIRSCKQMTTENLNVLLRTRTFMVLSRLDSRPGKKDLMINPLVFHRASTRNIFV